MNILHVIHKPEMGGIQKFVKNLIPPKNHMQNQYFLISSVSQKGDFINEFKSAGLIIKQYSNTKPTYFRPHLLYLIVKNLYSYFRLIRLLIIIRNNSINVVHSHLMIARDVELQLKACIVCKIPMVWTLHGLVSDKQTINGLQGEIINAQKAKLPFAITYVGERQKILEKLVFCDSTIVQPVPIGIKLSDFNVSAEIQEKKRQDYGIKSDEIVIGCTARLSPEKGVDVLLSAFEIIFEKVLNVKLFIAGEGCCRETLENQRSKLKYPNKIVFLGQVEDIQSFLSLLDIYVQPSKGEGIPLAIIEAMAAGLPVVASKVGGIPIAVQDEKTGYLVKPNDPIALSSAILRLVNEKEIRRILGHKGKLYSQNFDINKIRNYYESLYRDIIKKALNRNYYFDNLQEK